ncbi:MAG: MFS transporter [Rickettsia sp.]|nr:MFS transporter [Rickettsia sp.]
MLHNRIINFFSNKNLLSTTFVSLIISLSIFVFYSYQYILRLLPNSIKPDIETLYLLDASQFANFAGSYYIGYVLLHMPLGLLISRFGGKLVVPISMFLTGVGVVPIFLEYNWYLVILGRFLSGIGSSCAAVAGFQFFREFYPDKYSRMIGLMMFFGLCTAKFSEEYFSSLVLDFGLNYILKIVFFFSCILSFLTYFLFPNISNQLKKNVKGNILLDLKNILFNPKVISLSLCAALMVGSLEGFSDAWGSAFLMNVYNLDKTFSDYLVSYVFIGMALGTLVLPYLADKFKFWYNITLFSCIGMFLPFALLLRQCFDIAYLQYIFFIIGFFCAYQAVTVPMVASYVDLSKSGVASTLVNMIVMFFGTIFHKIIGYLIKYYSMKGYSMSAVYIIGVSVVPLALFIAFVTMLILKKFWKIKH